MLSKSKRRRNRRGATAVEFAVIAPIFFLVILGGIEFASVHITQCAMENAAFEGARRGIVPGANAETCRASAEALMSGAGVNEFTVTVTPDVITPATNAVKVSVSVPMTVETTRLWSRRLSCRASMAANDSIWGQNDGTKRMKSHSF